MFYYNRYDRKIGHNERKLNQSDFIVSKTDLKGSITYANPTFLEISGYHTAELLGFNHNIIRHPDMPRTLFFYVWEQLKAGKALYAYVKNLAKDGSFYWTFAYIAPDYNARGETIGYHSERRAPNPKAIMDITLLYDRIKQLEIQYDMETALEHLLTVASQKGGSYEHYIYTLQNQH